MPPSLPPTVEGLATALHISSFICHLSSVGLAKICIYGASMNSPVVNEVFAAGGTVLAKPWGQRVQHPGLFTKLDFKSIYVPDQSRAQPERWSHWSQAKPSNSIQKSAGRVPCGPNARKPHQERAEPFQLQLTKTARRSFASYSKPSQVALCCAKEPPSNTRSLTSRPARAAALDILVFAEISSTSVAPRQFRTSKEFISYFGTPRNMPMLRRFHYVRRSSRLQRAPLTHNNRIWDGRRVRQ